MLSQLSQLGTQTSTGIALQAAAVLVGWVM
jgi:hypothetical protein